MALEELEILMAKDQGGDKSKPKDKGGDSDSGADSDFSGEEQQ
jgi:hypothetical protein